MCMSQCLSGGPRTTLYLTEGGLCTISWTLESCPSVLLSVLFLLVVSRDLAFSVVYLLLPLESWFDIVNFSFISRSMSEAVSFQYNGTCT